LILDAGCSTNVGSAASYRWDLGDGRSATGSRVEARYRRSGEFTVRLSVQDREVTSEATAEIHVRKRPEACFLFHQVLANESEEPCTAVFDATCSEGSVKEYRWVFEGGARAGDPPQGPKDTNVTTREPHVLHSWREEIECVAFRPFRRLVRLTVVDDGGATDTHEETVLFAVPMLRR
jgi:PKD repeat protein